MNIFLHQLDVKIQAFMNQEKNLYYVRYADDMIFAIKKGENSYFIQNMIDSFF